MDFTLSQEDAEWCRETTVRAMDELRQSAPGGRAFSDTVKDMLERERGWVRWKNELCAQFDLPPWSAEVEQADEEGGMRKRRKVGLWEATKEARRNIVKLKEDWPHRLGSEALTEVWDMGYRSLEDLQMPFRYLSLFRFPDNVLRLTMSIYQTGRREGLCQEGPVRGSQD
jgi:hypothetical protein